MDNLWGITAPRLAQSSGLTGIQVQSYMSSLLQAAAPAPTDPQVNGALLIHSDVNPAGAAWTYTARMSSPPSVMKP